MTNHLEAVAGFISTITAAIFGAVTIPSLAEIASSDGLPDWAKWMLGPLGALIGMIIAIRWLTTRLDKAETREQARQVERDAQMAEVLKLGYRATEVIEQNNRHLERLEPK